MLIGSLTEYEATLSLEDSRLVEVWGGFFISDRGDIAFSFNLTFDPAKSNVKIRSSDVLDKLALRDWLR
jgi:hypothetical protein